MRSSGGDAGVFIRSMATRGHLGGLSHATADAAMDLLNDLKAGGYKIVFMQPKFAVPTIAAYDEKLLKQVKGPGGGDARPTSSVVRTISE